MPESIRITIEANDATGAGITSAIGNIGKLEKAASDATGKAGSGGTGIGGSGLSGLGSAFSNLGFQALKWGGALLGAVGGIEGVIDFTKKAYVETAKYSAEVRDLSLISKTSTEDTSKFIQVLDDYQLTAQDAEISTKALTKNGYAPTIETLAKLSDEYLKINDAEERNAFILKNLGKGGLEWVNMLNQGGDALRKQGEAISQNLIRTTEQQDRAEKARLKLDELGDAWAGVKYSVGDAVNNIIVANDEMAFKMDYLRVVSGKSAAQIINSHGEIKDSFQPMIAEYQRAAAMGDYWEKLLEKTNKTSQETSFDYAELTKGGLALTKVQSDFSDKLAKVNDFFSDKSNARKAYKDDMNELKQQFKDGELSLRQYNQAVLEQQQAWEKGTFVSKAQKEATRALGEEQGQQGANFLSSILEQKGASDELKYSYAAASKQISSGAAEQYKNISKIADAFLQGKATAEQAAAAARAVSGDLAALSGLSVSAYVDLYIRTHGSMDLSLLNPNRGNQRVGGEQLASGGWLTGKNWVIVGDTPGGLTPYSEAISPDGRVYNARETRWLIQNGFIDMDNVRRAAMGIDEGGGMLNPTSTLSAARNIRNRNISLTSLRSMGGGISQTTSDVAIENTLQTMISTTNTLNTAVTKLLMGQQTTQTMDISSMSQRGLAKNIGAELAKVVNPI